MNAVSDIMNRFVTYIINPAILIVFTLGFFLFIYGLVEFLWNLSEGGENKEGKQHMLWGIVGMLIMVSVWGILDILDGTFGLDYKNPDVSRAENISMPGNFFTGN